MKHWIHLLMMVVMSTVTNADTLEVTGTAFVSHSPDQAIIDASITSSQSSAQAAFTQNSEAMVNLQHALKKFGVEKNQLETHQFSFYPKYQWIDNRSVFDGYAVTHTLLIKTQKMDQLGELLDIIIAAGATQVNSVIFNHTRTSDFRAQALVAAVEDAEKQAKLLAQTTGVSLGKVVSIQADQHNQSQQPMPLMADAQMRSEMEIIPGDKKQSATVIIKYAIE